MKGYKKVNLYKHYINFIPQQYHSDVLYLKPSDEVLKTEKEDQKRRRDEKKIKKKEQQSNKIVDPVAHPSGLLIRIL
jgi:hypothetical protein